MVHVKKENIEYLQFRRLLEYEKEITHAYTLRNNGINFGREVGNECLEKQQNILKKALKIESATIVRPYQKHTDEIKRICTGKENLQEVDGLITNKTNLACMLVYADCTPILIYDPVKKVIANIHSGWRGTVQQIGRKAIEKMIKWYECKPQDLICCLGPCIGSCCFEVENDVKEQFEMSFSSSILQDTIDATNNDRGKQKYYIDTTKINRKILEEIGVLPENIIESHICTVCEAEQIHSYRKEKQNSGRNAAILSIN